MFEIQSTLTNALATPSVFAYLAVFVLGIFVSLGSCAIMELPLLMGYIGGVGSYMVTKGTILAGVTLLLTYVFGQSIPILIAGAAVGWLKQFAHRFARWEEYLQIASGIFLIVIAFDLIWLA